MRRLSQVKADALNMGRDFQRTAQHAFDCGDVDTAYEMYIDAEAQYRTAFPTVGDRVFFMQVSALRCLEELIESRPGLITTYRAMATQFLREWTPSQIKIAISYERISEAQIFRAFRKVTLQSVGSNAFLEANLAIEAEDFEKAHQLLAECIDEYSRSTDPERDAIITISRWKQCISVAKSEIRQRRFNRDLNRVACTYLRAAKVATLPAGTLSKQRDRIASYRSIALSNALKYRATSMLIRRARTIEGTIRSLEAAERFLRRAVHYARAALGTNMRRSELSPIYASRVEYSHRTVLERIYLLRFMMTKEEHYLSSAIQAWEGALQIARQLALDDEAYFFPNRFYSIKDLELEELFINAAKAFRNAHFDTCASLLKEWLNSYPDEYLWTWRYSNVRVRMLGASVLAYIWEDGSLNRLSMNKAMTELVTLVEKEPIGAAASYFAEEIKRLVPRAAFARARKEDIWNDLYPYFLLDPAVERYGQPGDAEPFDSLPKNVAWGLCQPARITSRKVEQARLDLLASVEAMLGYICDYDAQWICPEESLPRAAIDELLQFIRRFEWAKTMPSKGFLDRLCENLLLIRNTTSADKFSAIYEQTRQIVRHILNFVPLIVSVDSAITQTAQQGHYIVASPDWGIDRPERESIRIAVRSSGSLPIAPGQYYLPPPWRKGNRLFYMVDNDDNRPLFPVRFKPNWELPPWADEKLSREMPSLRAKGEGQRLEYKVDFPPQAQDLAKEIAAFATSDGGLILIGVKDKTGDLIGLEQANSAAGRDGIIERVEGIHGKLDPRVITERAFAKESDKVVLCITVPDIGDVCYCNGIPYIRDGTQSRRATADEVKKKNRR